MAALSEPGASIRAAATHFLEQVVMFIIDFNSPMKGTKARIKTEQIFLTLGSEARD